MLTIRQYNKLIHDWIVLLTGLSGSNVRPQKNKFGFKLTESNGKPIAFDSEVALFYFSFDGDAMDRVYSDNDTATNLKRASVNITFVGENSEQLASQMQATCLGSISRNYLQENGFAIMGNPELLNTDKEYSEKWFYRRTVKISLNCSLDFTPANGSVMEIKEVPITAQWLESGIQVPTAYYDTSDATATPEDVLLGKTFYNKDGKQTGTYYNTFKKYNIVQIPDDSGHSILHITDFQEGDLNPYYIGLVREENGNQRIYIVSI